MRAKRVNEDIRFERGIEPKEGMDIGRTPNRVLGEMKETLSEVDIDMEYWSSPSTGSDNYELDFFGRDLENDSGEASSWVYYTPKGIAKMDQEERPDAPGFYPDKVYGVYEYTESPEQLIKNVIGEIYGEKKDILRVRGEMKKKLDIMDKILGLLK